MTASLAMLSTISFVTIFGADTPINTSAPAKVSAREPAFFSRFVILLISFLTGFMPSALPSQIAPWRSHKVIFLYPAFNNNFAIEIAAAPAPFITIFTCDFSFFTSFIALFKPASVITAVPC